jgi:hypothetical protein
MHDAPAQHFEDAFGQRRIVSSGYAEAEQMIAQFAAGWRIRQVDALINDGPFRVHHRQRRRSIEDAKRAFPLSSRRLAPSDDLKRRHIYPQCLAANGPSVRQTAYRSYLRRDRSSPGVTYM